MDVLKTTKGLLALALAAGAGKQEVGDAFLAQSLLHDLEPLRRTLDLALKQTIALCDAQSDSKRPVFIVSHSLGALVAASYLMQVRNEDDPAKRVRGIVFLAPAFAVSEPPGWRGWVANPLIKLSFYAETHFLYPQNEPLPLLIFNQLRIIFLVVFSIPPENPMHDVVGLLGLGLYYATHDGVTDYLTDSEAEKVRLRADNWIVRRSLLRYVKGIEEEVVRFRRKMDQFTIPYYLVYSEHDPITPAWGNEDFARATLKNHSDNEVLALPNLYYHQHLFLKEPARTELLMKIEKWMDHRLRTL